MHPESISNNSRAGELEIRWQDGTLQYLDHTFLRTQCQCADCKSARIAGSMPAAAPDIRITGIVPVGAYGVQLIFSDGHLRGIYPWIYLRRLEDATACPPEAEALASF
jgi:DUF971 family protein